MNRRGLQGFSPVHSVPHMRGDKISLRDILYNAPFPMRERREEEKGATKARFMMSILGTQNEDGTDNPAVVRGTGVYRIGGEEPGAVSSV